MVLVGFLLLAALPLVYHRVYDAVPVVLLPFAVVSRWSLASRFPAWKEIYPSAIALDAIVAGMSSVALVMFHTAARGYAKPGRNWVPIRSS